MWDRVLVGLFAIAIAAGLVIAMANTLGGETEGANAVVTTEPSPSASPPTPTVRRLLVLWERTAEGLQLPTDIGKHFLYECPPASWVLLGDARLGVWGTRVYTADSSVCAAAVHWGLITVADGGTVTIEVRPGRDSYRGTRRNGVVSMDWPEAWSRSFVLVVPDRD